MLAAQVWNRVLFLAISYHLLYVMEFFASSSFSSRAQLRHRHVREPVECSKGRDGRRRVAERRERPYPTIVSGFPTPGFKSVSFAGRPVLSPAHAKTRSLDHGARTSARLG